MKSKSTPQRNTSNRPSYQRRVFRRLLGELATHVDDSLKPLASLRERGVEESPDLAMQELCAAGLELRSSIAKVGGAVETDLEEQAG